ncbi:hypothetical protein CVIRNUC_010027 [Coccomyxa viridis]|uniref:Alpha/beta hydrolase fold-3 domain-containing protein n=1 Tax=Coccomyxa viridis TaxID=1274662 RepID=A0AAV1IHJ2_9CHLO|nr:hypothetical protein CVIRNUC_010027 [Coccomyxa viridis]
MHCRQEGPVEPVHSVEDRTIPGPACQIPIRIYRPQPDSKQPLSALVYYHGLGVEIMWLRAGGGFTMWGLDTHDSLCRALANSVPCVVVSVAYRLAPEHQFPAGLEDCYAALQWVTQNAAAIGATSGLVAVGGDSAGGNLTAGVTLLARDGGIRIAFQLLYYPVVGLPEDGRVWPSRLEFWALGSEALLLEEDEQFLFQSYAPSTAQQTDARFRLMAADPHGLPPALVLTCGVDSLRDEGQAYAEKLKAAGVPVEFKLFSDTFHSFLHFPHLAQTKQALVLSQQALRKAFGIVCT